MKESLEYVNKANAAHKEQVSHPPSLPSTTPQPNHSRLLPAPQMDLDLSRAKAGLDAIENHTQLQNDQRMIRIKKAVKTGDLCVKAAVCACVGAFLSLAPLQRRHRQADG